MTLKERICICKIMAEPTKYRIMSDLCMLASDKLLPVARMLRRFEEKDIPRTLLRMSVSVHRRINKAGLCAVNSAMAYDLRYTEILRSISDYLDKLDRVE